jgi:hypothetical protein
MMDVAMMTLPVSVTIRRDDLRKFQRPPNLDRERQSAGLGTGRVSAPSRRTNTLFDHTPAGTWLRRFLT